jgi:hypothetical protein
MTLAIELIRTPEFIRASPHGILDFAATKETLASIARACLKRGLKRALLDLRGLPVRRVPFTCSELVGLVETFRDSGFGKAHRLAVLYSEDRHRGAPLFSFIGRMHGWNVRAFKVFEEALHWLSDRGDDKSIEPDAAEFTVSLSEQSELKFRPE